MQPGNMQLHLGSEPWGLGENHGCGRESQGKWQHRADLASGLSGREMKQTVHRDWE